ncbi:MAG: hypothetical protein HQ527_07845 [Cyanobacteria bacterium]|nr:hypothetical protein [Cyanobacteria bacterium bin.51]
MAFDVAGVGAELLKQPGITGTLALRVSPAYSYLLEALAADVGQSKASLVRLALEHYFVHARPDANPALVEQLVEAGNKIGCRPHHSVRGKAGTSSTSAK